VSEFGTAGTQGKVLLYFDTDATGPPPVTKQQIEDSVYHNDGMPCDPVIRLPIDVVRLRRNDSKYVRTGAQPANTDLKTFDSGNFYCAVDSTANTSTIGELRVRYRVKFTCPILTSAAATGGVAHFSSITSTTANNFAGNVLQAGFTPALGGITLGTNTIVFPVGIPGNYLVSLSVAGGTSASETTVNSFGTATQLLLFTSGAARSASAQAFSLAGTTTAFAVDTFSFTVPAAGCTITMNASAIVGTGQMDLLIVALPVTVLTEDEKEQLEIDNLQAEVDKQRTEMLSMQIALRRLEGLLTPRDTPIMALGASCGSTPDECKEADLDQSVHISRSMVAKLLGRK
jgi:hypothetical protein